VTEVIKRALYFGYGDGGHFLHDGNGRISSYKYEERYPGFPWDIGLLDAGLLKNRKVQDWPDGRVHWTCGGNPMWIAFFWWDRSGDKRSASNSGFYVQGFNLVPKENRDEQLRAAFEFACSQWPDVIKRQEFPLALQPCLLETQ
jgi:hypothetical protein